MLKDIMSKVRNVVAVCFSRPKALAAAALGAGSAVLGSAGLSYADLAADVQTSITSAQGTALTIGGYVVAAVAALVVVGLAIMMVKKLG